jgi:hypothetical protein
LSRCKSDQHNSAQDSNELHAMHATSITAACRRARRGGPAANRRTTLKGVTAACAVAAAPSPADAIEKASKSRAAQLTGVLYDCRRGLASPATPDALASMLNANVLGAGAPLTRGVLCVSERHDCFDHHLAQLYTIKQLRKALRQREDRAQVAVGLEAFQRIHQTYLDRYVSADPNYGANPRGNQNVAIDATGRVGSMAWSFQAIAATLSP